MLRNHKNNLSTGTELNTPTIPSVDEKKTLYAPQSAMGQPINVYAQKTVWLCELKWSDTAFWLCTPVYFIFHPHVSQLT